MFSAMINKDKKRDDVADISQIKQMYVKGLSITDIASALNITRQTIYRYKNRDESEGVLWDELRLRASRDIGDIKVKEAIFINTLISSFDKFIQKANDDDEGLSEKVLDKLNSYAKTYWSLKAPTRLDTKELTLDVAKKTLEKIANLALEKKDSAVIEFLSEYSDTIVKEVISRGTRRT